MTDLALLAQQEITPTSVGGLVGGGGIAGLSIAAIWWLIRYYTGEITSITAKFDATISRKDQQIVDLIDKAQVAQANIVSRYESLIREIRDDNRRRDDQWVGVNKEMASALERVSGAVDATRQAMDDVRVAMGEIKNEIKVLSGRVDGLDKPARGGRGG